MAQAQETRKGQTAAQTEWTRAQRDAVNAELESILADSAFRKSQRCVNLLRRMVEHALAGDCDSVKERTLGVEVFGRDWDYDSNSDPIVRMTANDIRKRLAQVYQNSQTVHATRIRLTPGSYIPEFDFLSAAPAEVFTEGVEGRPAQLPVPQVTVEQPLEAIQHAIIHRGRAVWAAITVLVVLAAAVMFLGRGKLFPSTQYLVWKPLIQTKGPLIICVADNGVLQQKGAEQLSPEEKRVKLQKIADMVRLRQAPAVTDPVNFDPTTPFVDAQVAHEISSWLGNQGQSTVLRPSTALNLQDLRKGPVVLIGGFDNPWTVILLSDMRFSTRVNAENGTFWIADAKNPSKQDWVRHLFEEPQPAIDYAVVTRFLDTETGNWVIAIAGLGRHGTEAASELIVDPAFAKLLPPEIRSAQNFQLVVSTKVINSNTGPPQIAAFQTW